MGRSESASDATNATEVSNVSKADGVGGIGVEKGGNSALLATVGDAKRRHK